MTSGAWIVVLILVVVVGGVNLAMYGLVRSSFRPDNKDAWNLLGKSLNVAQKKDDPMNELRRKMEELEKGKKE